MKNNLLRSTKIIVCGFGFLIIFSGLALAITVGSSVKQSLVLEIISSNSLNGTAGDFVDISGQITNIGSESVSDITTYLSLVDEGQQIARRP